MANGTILNLGSGGDTVQNIDNATYKTPVAALTNSTGTTFAAVKGASTAALATDSALVVTISPNNTVTVAEAPDLTASGSLTSASSVTLPALNNASGVSVQITGTWAGTISFEGSVDGTNFFAISGNPFASSGVLISTTTANGQWQFDVGAVQLFRARCSTYTSGTIIVNLRSSAANSLIALDSPIPPGTNLIGKIGIDQTTVGSTNAVSLAQIGATTIVTGGLAGSQGVGGLAASGSAVSGNPILISGSDGANARSIKVDASGAVTIIANQDAINTGSIISASTTVGPFSVLNRNLATVSIRGTYAGVVFIIECSDDGTNYYPAQSINNSTGQASSSGSWTPGTNISASYDLAIGGYTNIRVRSTAWTSGTANIGITLQTFAYDPVVGAISQGVVAAGVTALGNPVLIAGVFNTALPTYTTGQAAQLQTTAKGTLLSTISDGTTTAGVIVATTALKTDSSSIAGTAIPSAGVAGAMPVGGITAALATSTGNPVSVGGTCLLTAPTKATNGQRVSQAMDSYGRTITTTAADRTFTGTNLTASGTLTATVTETTVLASVAATFLDITGIQITNSSATATLVTLRDLSAGTTTNIRKIFSIAAGGGIAVTFNPPLAQGAVNNNWTLQCGTSVSSIYCMIDYIKNT